MKLTVGQSAEVSRRFPASDAAVFAGLAGLDRLPQEVPQPLIGSIALKEKTRISAPVSAAVVSGTVHCAG